MSQRLGIIGCGQLGLMLGRAAIKLGVTVSFLKVNEIPVVEGIGRVFDETELQDFLANVDFVTIEREAIPEEILKEVSEKTVLAPSFDALICLRQRHTQKALFDSLGIPTAPWVYVERASDLAAAVESLPSVRVRAKRVLGGYDGGGQWKIVKGAALPAIPEDNYPVILEAEVTIDFEVSVLQARSQTGEIKAYPVNENVMRNGILTWSFVPADIDEAMAEQAKEYAAKLMDSLSYAGVLAMEFFVSDGKLVVNEIAPRVHNTGHWTIEGCICDQFEQHVRAVMGMPLGDPKPVGAAGMCNVLGDEFPARLPPEPVKMYLHGYGKSFRPGRKMGHLTLTGPSLDVIKDAANNMGFMDS